MSEAAQQYIKAPFPAFGGKSRVAAEVWARFGNVRNYIEPFCFSTAVLLKRPGGAGAVETINDRNAFVANFWRAVRSDPDAVAEHADWPVIETDLHARHRWLVTSGEAIAALDRVRAEPDYYDARIAGWWCWGACCWIGAGWRDEVESAKIPRISDSVGVNGGRLPYLTSSQGINTAAGPNDRQPALAQPGWGINAVAAWDRHAKRLMYNADGLGNGIARNIDAPDDTHRPQLADEFSRGRGVDGAMDQMTCSDRRRWITQWMHRLADRLRPVRVCCGHWNRVCDSPSTMTRLGLTGVFLDPPYRVTLACGKANRTKHIYANDRHQDVNALCDEVQEWCLRWASDREVRIALCGLEGEYPEIERPGSGWTTFAWKSNGVYGNRNKDNENARRERIWFSPHCLVPGAGDGGLFTGATP